MAENSEEQDKNSKEQDNGEQNRGKRWASWLVGEIEDYLSKHKNIIALTRSILLASLISLFAICIEIELVAEPLQPLHTFLVKIIWPILSFLAKSTFQILGLAISISLALGFASHIQDALDYSLVHAGNEEKKGSGIRQNINLRKSDLSVQHDRSYHALMASAGYSIDASLPLRGQRDVVPTPHDQKSGVDLMNSLFPTLPTVVRNELGEIIDLVIRDFVVSWFCNLQVEASSPEGCKALTSTDASRSHPFLISVSASMTHFIGRLCTVSAENINVMELLLVHVVKCLSLAVNVYRKMKKRAMVRLEESKKSGLESVEELFEVAVAREFLLAGHVHKAITFGIDLKALCHSADGNPISENELHDLLFKSSLFTESEQDYNRILAHRLCRKLLLQSDFNSTPLRAFAVETIATCLLAPIMACWTPEYMNFGLVKGLQMVQSTNDLSEESAHDSVEDEADALEDGVKCENGESDTTQPIDTPPISKGVDTTEPNNSETLQRIDEERSISPMKKETLKKEEEVILNSLVSATTTTGLPIGIDTEIETIVEDINPNEVFSDENQCISQEVEVEEPMEENEADEETNKDEELNASHILPLTTLAVAEMQTFLNTQEYKNEDDEVDWMHKTVRTTVCQLVLVIEAAMRHGRIQNGHVSLSMVLMDMTTNIGEFEKKVDGLGEEYFLQFEAATEKVEDKIEDEDDVYVASPDGGMFTDESSTFRTLIAAWLQTGDIYSALKVLSSTQILLERFYTTSAFLRTADVLSVFLSRLKPLDYIPVLVDTMSVLAADALSSKELEGEKVVEEKKDRRSELQQQGSISSIMQKFQGNKEGNIGMAVKSGLLSKPLKFTKWVGASISNPEQPPPETKKPVESKPAEPKQVGSGSVIPTHLDFNANASLASNLRLERERRLDSWRKANVATFTTPDGKYRMIDMIHSPQSRVVHRELHSLARQFVSNTFKLGIRQNESEDKTEDKCEDKHKISLEYLSGRRVMDIPDDDSGFLLRAQQRPLNPIGVHVDQRNHEQTYKCFVTSYEEPIMNHTNNRYSGGRYLHYCLLKYFPSDRTAAVTSFHNDRYFSKEFLMKRDNATLPDKLKNQRKLCQKAQQRATSGSVLPGNVLASNVMDSSDFASLPRTGKAVDFIYRIPFYEKPVVELGGKRFTVHDGNRTGPHRADASCLELSDASLSVALLLRSQLVYTIDHPENDNSGDAAPLIYMKVSTKSDQNDVEIKGFRPSHIRAALMIASARQDAQLQCLTWCVRSGSARKATKARIEAILQPSLTILDFASSKHEKESILIRDLKLGMNHIDREHLRRNGILNPRYPTMLRGLNAKVESWTQGSISESASSTLFKIRCVALSEVIFHDDTTNNTTERQVYRLEWNVHRQFREILAFHKHIKSQVSSLESGAAPKFFSAGIMPPRKGLVPSLANAAKGGPLGASTSQRALEKRRDALNDYFGTLLSRNHLLKRSPELLKFLGADKAFTPEIEGMDGSVKNHSDFYGRKNIKITRLDASNFPEIGSTSTPTTVTVSVHNKDAKSNTDDLKKKSDTESGASQKQTNNAPASNETNNNSNEKRNSDTASKSAAGKKYADRMRMAQIASVKSRIDRIRLSSVRNSIFDLIRSLFDLDAYVFRSRLMSAIRTMSFVITNSTDFSQLLLDSHLQYVNGDSIADILIMIREIIWPDGVFKTSAQEDPEKNLALKKESLEAMAVLFPDQLRRLLGQEITQEGLTLLHEMLQNRVIVKSLGYIIIDIVLLSIFPDFSDLLDGTEVLESSV